MKINYNLNCWYLHMERISGLLNIRNLGDQFELYKTISLIPDQLKKIAIINLFTNHVKEFLIDTNPDHLEKIILNDELEEGKLFTCYANFYCKGLTEIDPDDANKTTKMAKLHTKLKIKDYKLVIHYHPRHLTTLSAWAELSGRKDAMVLGYISEIQGNIIEAKPIAIADRIVPLRGSGVLSSSFPLNKGEIFIDQIDSFKKVDGINFTKDVRELEPLKDIPEEEIKGAFAEIISESSVPKDWAGETSDLYSTHVEIDGTRISTAFLFKGPAAFRPMKNKELGKNGDQINRLYKEPADLLILQHCHEITKPVRELMRVFALQSGNLRNYTIIDGFDTLRILKAYHKCGM